MRSLDHIFQPKVTKKYLKRRAKKRIGDEKQKLNGLGVTGEELEERMKVNRLTEMKKAESGFLTGWKKLRKGQKNDMRNYLLFHNKLEEITVQKISYTLPRSVKTHQDFTKHILRQNLFADIFIDLQKYEGKSSFPCLLFPENWASISKDDNGIYRYFTNRPGGISVSLNIFDLVETICSHEGESFTNVRRKLIQILACSYPENKWEMKQMDKAQININIISNAETSWTNQYPSLFKLTRSYLDILLAMNSHSGKHINSKQYSYKKENLFFLSSRFLANILDRDPSNVRRAINLFACLGLIEKVPPNVEGFPLKCIQSAIKIRGNITDYKLVTFFIIPQLTQKLLKNAETKAKKLLENKITNITKLNEEKMAVVFGEDFARLIYYANEIDLQQLVKQSKVDLLECKQADTFKTEREMKRLESGQGTPGDDVIPF
jgi:hypothetical protein